MRISFTFTAIFFVILFSYLFYEYAPYGHSLWMDEFLSWFEQIFFYPPISLVCMFGLIAFGTRRFLITKARKQLLKASKTDSSWDLDHFIETGKNIFYLYQKAKTEKDFSSAVLFLHPRFARKVQIEMSTSLKGKTNILRDISIINTNLISILDVEGREGDMFVLEFDYMILNYTIDKETGAFKDSPLTQYENESLEVWKKRAQLERVRTQDYWVYYRYENEWFLYDVIVSKKKEDVLKVSKKSWLQSISEKEQGRRYADVDIDKECDDEAS